MNKIKFKGGGYYSVLLADEESAHKVPYTVYAASDWHAARMVRDATGYMPRAHEVEGPY